GEACSVYVPSMSIDESFALCAHSSHYRGEEMKWQEETGISYNSVVKRLALPMARFNTVAGT
ncbi:MAG: hypothetical protein ACJ795_02270, partial [Ktedonobacteraceae bacterium]